MDTSQATILLAGGAGFLGSHLGDRLIESNRVVCVDNLSTGRPENIAQLQKHPRFHFVEADIVHSLPTAVTSHHYDFIVNLASPASPPHYKRLALETLAVGSTGTFNLLELARRDEARFIHASTSEVYGDPEVHPQPEIYWGYVNPYGPRSMYDEAKRFSEALIYAYRRRHDLSTGIVRIFNTYGPRMDAADGRVISNFIVQALRNEPLTIYGDGTQTRSFCYVDDLIEAIVRMIKSKQEGPINIGNPTEFTVNELAKKVLTLTGSSAGTVNEPLSEDDPAQRRPDISLAKEKFGWEPKVELNEGLKETIDYFKKELKSMR